MAEGPYLRPPWFARVVGNRMAVLLNPTVRVLSVRGRTSGRWRSVAVVVLEHAGQAYLRRYGRMPRLAATFRKLPDPTDHPAFRIVKSEQEDRRDRRRD